MKITKLQEVRYKNRLEHLQSLEPELNKAVEVAAKFGDTSENSELDAAKEELSRNKLEQGEIIEILNNAEIINYDTSSLIVEGSIIEVSNGTMKKVLLLSDVGNLVLDGVLHTSSPLGKAVFGNTEGNFKVNNHNFYVKKIMNPDIESFIEEYPSSDEVLDRLFSKSKNKEDENVDNNPSI